MKQLNFAIAMLVAIVVLANESVGQVALKPYNGLAKSIDQFYLVPENMTIPVFTDHINKWRDSLYQWGNLSIEKMLEFLPENIWSNDKIITKGRTFPIGFSQFKSDFYQRFGYRMVNGKKVVYKIWHYSNVEPLGFGNFTDADVAARILPQLPNVGVYIPQPVQTKLLQVLATEHPYQTGEFIPGDVLLFSSYRSHGQDVVWAWTVVGASNSNDGFKRVWHLPNRQLAISYQNKTYVFCFVREYRNNEWFGCNNFGAFIVAGNHGIPAESSADKGDGKNDGGETNQPPDVIPDNPIVNPPNPNPLKPCDTTRTVEGGKNYLVIRCPGELSIKIEVNVNCCPPSGGAVQPPVVVPPVIDDTVKKIKPIPVKPIPVKPIPVKPIITPDIQPQPENKPCDCEVPLLSGNIYGLFDYGVFETAEGGDNTVRFGDFEGSLHVNPLKGNMSWLGFSGRLHYFPYMERKVKRGQTELYLFGPSATIRGENSINRFLLGFARINKRIVYQRYTFELRPWPYDMAIKIEQPEKMTVNGGLGFNWEHFEQDRFSFEIRGTWGFHPYQYFETYGNFLYHFPNSGWSLLGAYWREDQQDFPSAVVNQLNQPLYLIPATISQQAELQIRFPIARKSTSDNSMAAAIARKFGQSVAHQGDGNRVTGYGIAQWQNLMSSDYTSRQACLGLGIIFHDFPFERAYLEFRSVYYPADFMRLSEYKPFPAKNPLTGLWEENWTRIDSWTRRFDVMIAVSYYF